MREDADGSRVLLVGYGTLLWRPSVEHTLGRAEDGERPLRPVVVHGFRRLFNLRPDHYRASLRWGRPGVENGAMNVEPAPGERFNGVALAVTAGELDRLDRREYTYDRLEVEAVDFAGGALVGPAWVYSAPLDGRWIERDPDRLLPRWRDLVWARAGAYEIDRAFGLAFDATTYLADGRTLVAERYRGHLSPGHPPQPEEIRRETR